MDRGSSSDSDDMGRKSPDRPAYLGRRRRREKLRKTKGVPDLQPQSSSQARSGTEVDYSVLSAEDRAVLQARPLRRPDITALRKDTLTMFLKTHSILLARKSTKDDYVKAVVSFLKQADKSKAAVNRLKQADKRKAAEGASADGPSLPRNTRTLSAESSGSSSNARARLAPLTRQISWSDSSNSSSDLFLKPPLFPTRNKKESSTEGDSSASTPEVFYNFSSSRQKKDSSSDPLDSPPDCYGPSAFKNKIYSSGEDSTPLCVTPEIPSSFFKNMSDSSVEDNGPVSSSPEICGLFSKNKNNSDAEDNAPVGSSPEICVQFSKNKTDSSAEDNVPADRSSPELVPSPQFQEHWPDFQQDAWADCQTHSPRSPMRSPSPVLNASPSSPNPVLDASLRSPERSPNPVTNASPRSPERSPSPVLNAYPSSPERSPSPENNAYVRSPSLLLSDGGSPPKMELEKGDSSPDIVVTSSEPAVDTIAINPSLWADDVGRYNYDANEDFAGINLSQGDEASQQRGLQTCEAKFLGDYKQGGGSWATPSTCKCTVTMPELTKNVRLPLSLSATLREMLGLSVEQVVQHMVLFGEPDVGPGCKVKRLVRLRDLLEEQSRLMPPESGASKKRDFKSAEGAPEPRATRSHRLETASTSLQPSTSRAHSSALETIPKITSVIKHATWVPPIVTHGPNLTSASRSMPTPMKIIRDSSTPASSSAKTSQVSSKPASSSFSISAEPYSTPPTVMPAPTLSSSIKVLDPSRTSARRCYTTSTSTVTARNSTPTSASTSGSSSTASEIPGSSSVAAATVTSGALGQQPGPSGLESQVNSWRHLMQESEKLTRTGEMLAQFTNTMCKIHEYAMPPKPVRTTSSAAPPPPRVEPEVEAVCKYRLIYPHLGDKPRDPHEYQDHRPGKLFEWEITVSESGKARYPTCNAIYVEFDVMEDDEWQKLPKCKCPVDLDHFVQSYRLRPKQLEYMRANLSTANLHKLIRDIGATERTGTGCRVRLMEQIKLLLLSPIKQKRVPSVSDERSGGASTSTGGAASNPWTSVGDKYGWRSPSSILRRPQEGVTLPVTPDLNPVPRVECNPRPRTIVLSPAPSSSSCADWDTPGHGRSTMTAAGGSEPGRPPRPAAPYPAAAGEPAKQIVVEVDYLHRSRSCDAREYKICACNVTLDDMVGNVDPSLAGRLRIKMRCLFMESTEELVGRLTRKNHHVGSRCRAVLLRKLRSLWLTNQAKERATEPPAPQPRVKKHASFSLSPSLHTQPNSQPAASSSNSAALKRPHAACAEPELSQRIKVPRDSKGLQQFDFLDSSPAPTETASTSGPAGSGAITTDDVTRAILAISQSKLQLESDKTEQLASFVASSVKSFMEAAANNSLEQLIAAPASAASVTPTPSSASEEELKECVVCMEAGRDVLFVPCGHLVTCSSCSASLQECPMCRIKIQLKQPVFRS